LVVEVEDDEAFSAIVKEETLCMVDFQATWCGPCKTIAPKIIGLARVYPAIKFIKVDVDELEVLSPASVASLLPLLPPCTLAHASVIP
jgi:thioredoxin 1